MGRREHRRCRICKKRPVWRGGDVKNPGPYCKKCYHKRIWPDRIAARREKPRQELAPIPEEFWVDEPHEIFYTASEYGQPQFSPRVRSIMPRLPVEDIERAIAFYTGPLGFQVSLLRPPEVPTFAMLERGDIGVQFYVPNTEAGEAEVVGLGTLCFEVTNVRALQDALTEAGGPEV
jgi:hypothetical protein